MPVPGELLPGVRQAAWLLAAGGLVTFIGACWPPTRQWSAPLEDGLRVIAAHPIGWTCIHVGFLAGTWISTAGLVVLAWNWRGTNAGPWMLGAAIALALGSIFWTANITMRLGITPWAAREVVATGTIPPEFDSWRKVMSTCFAAFSVLAYAAVAGTGAACLKAGATSTTLAWLLVAWGVSGGWIVGAVIPLLAYLPYLILGVALLR